MYRIKIPHYNPDPAPGDSAWVWRYVISLEFVGTSMYFRSSYSVDDAVIVPEPVARWVYEYGVKSRYPLEMERI